MSNITDMKTHLRRCTRCILPETYTQIRFTNNGVCNYCQTYELLKPKLTDFNYLEALLKQRLDKLRGKYKYDCLVGLSGGKDSSYVTFMLKKKYNLKVLSFTFDNGFFTTYAKNNIKHVVSMLGIDHFFYTPDSERLSQIYRQALMKFGSPCLACANLTHFIALKLAFKESIPFIIHGRSRAQMFRSLLAGSMDTFLQLLKTNFVPYNPSEVKANTFLAQRRSRFLLSRMRNTEEVKKFLDHEIFPDPSFYRKGAFCPEVLGYFIFEDYDEKKIMSTLSREIDWKRPEDQRILTHQDCAAHDATSYLAHQILSWSLIEAEASALIREGKLSRQEALNRTMQEHVCFEFPDESMRILLDKCRISREELPAIIRSCRKSFKWLQFFLTLRDTLKKPRLEL